MGQNAMATVAILARFSNFSVFFIQAQVCRSVSVCLCFYRISIDVLSLAVHGME